jgi:carbon-monoxide dehydrogenase medium subunit
MKPYNFEHVIPNTIDEAVQLLRDCSGEAKLISGGQSLMPVLNFRLAKPDLLIDLKKLDHLKVIECTNTGTVLGSRVRWIDIEKNNDLTLHQPLLQKALSYVAHYQIRNRGTLGGSLANSDPAAELPLIALVLEATIKVVGPKGVRSINVNDFFTGFMSTSIAKDEIISEIFVPAWPATRRWGFEEFSRRKGDFAIAACALWYDLNSKDEIQNIHVGVIGANDYPVRLSKLEKILEHKVLTSDLLETAIETGLKDLNPPLDPQISQEYRLSLIATMIRRAFDQSMLGQ